MGEAHEEAEGMNVTEEEFLVLPDDEKDALVAERVLLWQIRWTERKHRGRPSGSYRCWVKDGRSWCACPCFATGWTRDFWIAVHCMKEERGVYVDLHPRHGCYEVIVRDQALKITARSSHKSAGLAVCIGLLKAVGAIV